MLLHKTNVYSNKRRGYDFWTEYRLTDTKVQRVTCRRRKVINGTEATFITDETIERSWGLYDRDMPLWIREEMLVQLESL